MSLASLQKRFSSAARREEEQAQGSLDVGNWLQAASHLAAAAMDHSAYAMCLKQGGPAHSEAKDRARAARRRAESLVESAIKAEVARCA